MCFGAHIKGLPVTKQRQSHWIVDAIPLAYASAGVQCSIGVRGHSTRGMASSWSWSSGIFIGEMCAVAGWSLPSTFIRFYSLDIPALQVRVFSCLMILLLLWAGKVYDELSSRSRLSSASAYSTALLDAFPKAVINEDVTEVTFR